jgi:hypothetical protein
LSTPSRGERDDFFDPRHVKIVEPNAAAVTRAVEEWLTNTTGRNYIQTATENYWSESFVYCLCTDWQAPTTAQIERRHPLIFWPPVKTYKQLKRWFVRPR